jgi:paraquat-inducible protein A
MLDIFVVAILVTLVQLQLVATVTPRAGALAFGGVVVLTMLSTMSFDPRLIWDSPREEKRRGRAL